MDYKEISERIALLMQEVRDLQQMNARYCQQSEYTRRINRPAHETREIRLLQIKEELSRMRKMSQQKATMRWQLGGKP